MLKALLFITSSITVSTGISLSGWWPDAGRCSFACPTGEDCKLSRKRGVRQWKDPQTHMIDLYGPASSLGASVTLANVASGGNTNAVIKVNNEEVRSVTVEFRLGTNNQLVVLPAADSIPSWVPAGSSVLRVGAVEGMNEFGKDPGSNLRDKLSSLSQQVGGSIALNADVASAVLNALHTELQAMHLGKEVIAAGCSRLGKLALRLAYVNDVVTSVLAVSSGAGGAATDAVVGSGSRDEPGCGETMPHLAHNRRWKSWARQGATATDLFGQGDVILAGLAKRGKTVYVTMSISDTWANPLGMWAGVVSAAGWASGAADGKIFVKVYHSNKHCDQTSNQPFDLSSFSSPRDVACPFSSEQCRLVDEYMVAVATVTQRAVVENFGNTAYCPTGMAASKFCGSGKNKDCTNEIRTGDQLQSSRVAGWLQCDVLAVATSEWTKKVTNQNVDGYPTCGSGYVIVGLCLSGENSDCEGNRNILYCAPAPKMTAIVAEETRCPESYDDSADYVTRACSPGYTLTALCNGGRNQDCHCGTNKAHVGARCSLFART